MMAILRVTVSRDDARWRAFGLQRPGARTTPGHPKEVRAGLAGTGVVLVSCAPEPLATRYLWRTRLGGTLTRFKLAASSPEPFALLLSLAG